MPALKQEYDYYEYARSRQGTAKKAVPSSAVSKKSKQVQTMTLKTNPTREATKKATRIAMGDDFIGTKKTRPATKKVSNTKKRELSKDEYLLSNRRKEKTFEKPSEMKLKKPKSNLKAREVAKQKAKVKEMLKNTFVASIIFGMLFLVCYRYSCINEAFNEVNDLKYSLKKKQTVNAQIESNIQKETDLAYIENYAKYQLGMQKPKDSQIQKINVKKQDKITTPIEIKEEEDEGVFTKILNGLLKILD